MATYDRPLSHTKTLRALRSKTSNAPLDKMTMVAPQGVFWTFGYTLRRESGCYFFNVEVSCIRGCGKRNVSVSSDGGGPLKIQEIRYSDGEAYITNIYYYLMAETMFRWQFWFVACSILRSIYVLPLFSSKSRCIWSGGQTRSYCDKHEKFRVVAIMLSTVLLYTRSTSHTADFPFKKPARGLKRHVERKMVHILVNPVTRTHHKADSRTEWRVLYLSRWNTRPQRRPLVRLLHTSTKYFVYM